MDHPEFCVQIRTVNGNSFIWVVVDGTIGWHVDSCRVFCKEINEFFPSPIFRVAIRTTGDWCECADAPLARPQPLEDSK